jgi:translation initiation factor 1
VAKKPKLNLTPGGGGLHNPFATLEVAGLPAGESVAPPTATSSRPAGPARPSKFGRVVLRREKAHRGGKTVIVIHDFAPHLGARYLDDLAARLKAACGCGGTAKDRTIEIQGDQPGRIRALLEQEGFRVAGVT